MIGIYKFTNLINNKSYIGQSQNIEYRYYQHSMNYLNKNQKEYNTYFYKALRKYGFNNFSFTILETTSIEKLDEREKYWIKYYDSFNPDKGYNNTPGGKTSYKIPKRIYQFDKYGNFINSYNSAKEAAIQIFKDETLTNGISMCALGTKLKTYHNFIFSYNSILTEEELKRRTTIKTARQVQGMSKDKKTIYIFNSAREAGRELNINFSNILKVLKGERKTAGGFYWKEI